MVQVSYRKRSMPHQAFYIIYNYAGSNEINRIESFSDVIIARAIFLLKITAVEALWRYQPAGHICGRETSRSFRQSIRFHRHRRSKRYREDSRQGRSLSSGVVPGKGQSSRERFSTKNPASARNSAALIVKSAPLICAGATIPPDGRKR